MTKIIAFFTSVITWFTMIFIPAEPLEGVFSEPSVSEKIEFDEGEFSMGSFDIIVSPDGDDNNPGTAEAPVATLKKAKEIAKSIDTDELITVWFREGTYLIDETVSFTSSDKNNVLFRSFPDEKVEITGAKAISEWTDTEVNGVRAFVADVAVENDNDYFRSLFKGNKRLPRSNYPKEGTFKIADPLTDEAIVPEFDSNFFTHSVAFNVHTSDLLSFSNPSDIDIKIMHFWCDDLLPVHSVDLSSGRVETNKASAMTVRVDDNYIFENVKEALSLPGEWYLDRTEDKLYYIPEADDTVDNTVLYAGVTEQLITFDGAKGISFAGIDFINTDWKHINGTHTGIPFPESHPLYANIELGTDHPQAAFEIPAAILISRSESINFTNCSFENISYTAVKFENASKNCDITTCKFNEIGANAIFIHGDYVVPATTENINIKDCHISRYGRIFNNAIGILLTHAINCELSNNEIHDGWYTGISVGWNWGYSDNPTNNIHIKDNLIYNIGNGWLSDMGGIYTLGIQPDSVISGNIVYNVGCDESAYGYGGWGIYLDEGTSYMTVENNLVYDCSSQTFHQHYGKENIVRNNIFAFGGEGQFIITRNEDHNSLTLTNNILVGDNTVMYKNCVKKDWFIDDSNLYWDYKNGGNIYSGDSMKLFERNTLVIMQTRGYYNNAVLKDPLFKDAANRDFTLADNSPALEAGFVPFSYNAGTITKF